jgi:ligand-binding SRPBCC domain-containing protein
MSLQSITDKIELGAPVEKTFEYFTDTDQVAKQFPQSLRLVITNRTARHLNQGSIIEFSARVYGLPMRWKSYVHSLATNRHIAYVWQQNLFFSSWEHDYYFESFRQQTRITECILYRLRFGLLGRMIDVLFVKPFVRRMLKYRRKELLALFGPAKAKASKAMSA